MASTEDQGETNHLTTPTFADSTAATGQGQLVQRWSGKTALYFLQTRSVTKITRNQVRCIVRTQRAARCGAACRQSPAAARITASDAVHGAAPSAAAEPPSSAPSTPSRPSHELVPPAEPRTVALHTQMHTHATELRFHVPLNKRTGHVGNGLSLLDTTHTVREAGSMKLSDVHTSIYLSIPTFAHRMPLWWVCC